jgi:hypothetical protein
MAKPWTYVPVHTGTTRSDLQRVLGPSAKTGDGSDYELDRNWIDEEARGPDHVNVIIVDEEAAQRRAIVSGKTVLTVSILLFTSTEMSQQAPINEITDYSIVGMTLTGEEIRFTGNKAHNYLEKGMKTNKAHNYCNKRIPQSGFSFHFTSRWMSLPRERLNGEQ